MHVIYEIYKIDVIYERVHLSVKVEIVAGTGAGCEELRKP